MGNRKMNSQASISVFFALVFLIILSLVLTSLETGRVLTAKSFAYSIINAAMESTLADYYGPLFDEYHIYGLDTGYGDRVAQPEEISGRAKEYCEYSLNPEEELPDIYLGDKRGFKNWDMSINKFRITDSTGLLDYDGELFKKQAIEYQKYDEAGNLIETILSKLQLLDKQSSTSKIMEKKLETEEELGEIDENIIQLMELIDGVQFDDGIIEKEDDNMVKVARNFVKKLCPSVPSAELLGLNHPVVYQSVCKVCINPISYLDIVLLNGKEYARLYRKKENSELQRTSIQEEITIYESEIDCYEEEMKRLEEEIEDIKEKKQDEEDEGGQDTMLNTLYIQRNELNDAIMTQERDLRMLEEQDRVISDECDKIDEALERISEESCEKEKNRKQLHEDTREIIQEAIEVIDEISEKQNELKPVVAAYETALNTAQSVLSSEQAEELSSSMRTMKEYVGLELDNPKLPYNIQEMKVTLSKNADLLDRISQIVISEVPDDCSEISEVKWCEAVDSIIESYKEYSYVNMVFDYSDLKLEVEDNVIEEGFKGLLAQGINYLVLENNNNVSEKSLESEILPSMSEYSVAETMQTSLAGEENFQAAADSGSGREMFSLSDSNSGLSGVGSILGAGINSIAEELLMVSYTRNNFGHYGGTTQNDKVLDYEQEYIIAADKADNVNLSSIIFRILLIRLVISSVYSFTNKTMTAKATAFATSVVGFTGLPFLISIVKYLTLFIWAFEQAVVETAVIMNGGKASLLTTNKTFCIAFEEIPVFSKSKVISKAKAYKESGVTLDYEDYLTIFLLLKNAREQNLNTMDLIQENIRNKYDDNFLLINCLHGYSAEIEIIMPARYILLPFAGYSRSDNISGYRLRVNSTVCY